MKMNPDGSATVTLPPDYLGDCSKCFKRDATHSEWLEFLNPIPAIEVAGIEIPAASGVWTMVCDECCDKEAKHER
jgi:hypothetical protein